MATCLNCTLLFFTFRLKFYFHHLVFKTFLLTSFSQILLLPASFIVCLLLPAVTWLFLFTVTIHCHCIYTCADKQGLEGFKCRPSLVIRLPSSDLSLLRNRIAKDIPLISPSSCSYTSPEILRRITVERIPLYRLTSWPAVALRPEGLPLPHRQQMVSLSNESRFSTSNNY